jgi:hypothetical protein
MACPATTRNGTPCSNAGSFFEGHCGIHHNSLHRRDVAYRARYQEWVNGIDARRNAADVRRRIHFPVDNEIRNEVVANIIEPLPQGQVVAPALNNELTEQARQANIERNRELYTTAPNFSPMQIITFAKHIYTLWHSSSLPGYDAIRAYIALRYKSSKHDGFNNLIQAVVTIVNQSVFNVENRRYEDVPQDERVTALATLTTALIPYGEIRIPQDIPARDKIHASVTARLTRERNEERRRVLMQQAEDQRRNLLARRVALERDLRERPVVFQRDPEAGINLQAFAQDHESVHRSSVQNSTHKAIHILLARPLREGQQTLEEVVTAFNHSTIVRFSSPQMKERAIHEITNDYFLTEAFSVLYGRVLDSVWSYIHPHEQREELIVRLAQEICDGIATCGNGKMARLVNVLQGYDESLEFEIPRVLFQDKFVLLRSRPRDEREAAATEVFNEFRIPEEERNVWLEPLLEEEA